MEKVAFPMKEVLLGIWTETECLFMDERESNNETIFSMSSVSEMGYLKGFFERELNNGVIGLSEYWIFGIRS